VLNTYCSLLLRALCLPLSCYFMALKSQVLCKIVCQLALEVR